MVVSWVHCLVLTTFTVLTQYFIISFIELKKPVDLIYTIDVSQQTSEEGIQAIRDYIKKDIALHHLSNEGTSVAIVTFADDAKVVLSPEDGTSLRNVLNSLSGIVTIQFSFVALNKSNKDGEKDRNIWYQLILVIFRNVVIWHNLKEINLLKTIFSTLPTFFLNSNSIL